MDHSRFAVILAAVILAAALTVWIATAMPVAAGALVIPILLAAALAVRLWAARR